MRSDFFIDLDKVELSYLKLFGLVTLKKRNIELKMFIKKYLNILFFPTKKLILTLSIKKLLQQ